MMRRTSRLLRRSLLLAAFCAFGALPRQADADLVIDLPELVVYGDGVNAINGELTVYLTVTEPELTSPPQVSSLNLDFSVAGSAVAFGTPTAPTISPLFVGGDVEFVLDPARVRFGHDIYDESPSSVAAGNGAALASVPFTVAAGEFGAWSLDFNNLNEIASSLALPLDVTLLGGSITAEFAVIPEASAWACLSAVTLGCWGARRLRRRALAIASVVNQSASY